MLIIGAIFNTFLNGVISGIIGNAADRVALEIKSKFVESFNKDDKRSTIFQTLQNAVAKSYYFALRDICAEVLDMENDKHIKKWLKKQISINKEIIKAAEQSDDSFLPIESIDHVRLLLAAAPNEADEIAAGKEKIIAYALDRPEPPVCYIEHVKNGLFERTCIYFNDEIYKNKEVFGILMHLLLSNIDQRLYRLSESLERHIEETKKNHAEINDKLDQLLVLLKEHAPNLEINLQKKEQKPVTEDHKETDSAAAHPLRGVEGIVSKEKLHGSERLPGEVFAIELLTEDIFLIKNEDRIKVKIDRRNTSHAIVANAGKLNLNKIIIEEKNLGDYLKKRDLQIQSYLNGTSPVADTYERVSLKEQQILLRWASGGVLPIVDYRGRKYISLFYRDKEPFGWNLFLGSSDRQFDEEGKLIKGVEAEYNNPSAFIAREFEEELLVFEEEPDFSNDKNKIIPISLPYRYDESSERFCEKHIKLRQEYDGLRIVEDDRKSIHCEFVNTKMELKIVDQKGKARRPFSNILMCFNLMELGIEAIQVIKFKLGDNNVLLDGEILSGEQDELVRMPIALISCDFLEKQFKGDLSRICYTQGTNPSMQIEKPVPSSEMVLFNYDLRERSKVVDKIKSKTGPMEELRYTTSFDKYFDKDTCTIKEEYTRYFTPSAAKALNLMFKQVDTKEYK